MKKNIFIFVIVVIMGVYSGVTLYNKVNSVYAYDNKNTIYLLQLGVYNSLDTMNSDTKDITNKLVIKDKKNYYVYVGISKDKNNLKKISKIYNRLGYNLYLKEEYINNEFFLTNIEQFDILLKNAKTEDEINSINSVILSSYEENILKSN